VQVPGPGGLVLQAWLVAAGWFEGGIPRAAADDLDGAAVAHGDGLEQRPEVVDGFGRRSLLPRCLGVDLAFGTLG
jgi:hypothetical protein